MPQWKVLISMATKIFVAKTRAEGNPDYDKVSMVKKALERADRGKLSQNTIKDLEELLDKC